MRNFLKKIKREQYKCSLFLILLLIDNLYTLSASYIVNSINPNFINIINNDSRSLFVTFLGSVIFAPLIETFIFQYLIIETLRYFKINKNVIIWFSCLVFTISHSYNLVYMLLIIFPGYLYSKYYIFLKDNRRNSPFLAIYFLHLLSNLFVFILDDILKI
jgi:hypothetical protein